MTPSVAYGPQLFLTCLTQIPGKSCWTSAVKTIHLVHACPIVQTRVAVTLVDICKKDNHSQLKLSHIDIVCCTF